MWGVRCRRERSDADEGKAEDVARLQPQPRREAIGAQQVAAVVSGGVEGRSPCGVGQREQPLRLIGDGAGVGAAVVGAVVWMVARKGLAA